MPKSKQQPNWRRHLRELMEQKGFNPRSLSLSAGLNPTAVRDMLEGRTMFPRYDTARALAHALNTTSAILMGDDELPAEITKKGPKFKDDLELLTEIIARLQEAINDYKSSRNPKHQTDPRNFAAMTATIFRQVRSGEIRDKDLGSIGPKIHDMLDYENLRQAKQRKHG